ncbi:MAG TPA: FAD-dependent oxidoreductase [Patescibacteria group bacterium]|nr:FAD-dependent oxidoreductase [Patescibacteria group bacterium]
MRLHFDHFSEETSQIKTFYFKPEEEVNYTAGQYMELTIKHPRPDNRGQKRWFTISSPPDGEFLTITTRINQEKSSSFKKALVKLKPGEELFMNGPFGDFVLPKLIQTPLIFVAGGIGITPFHSILEWLDKSNEERPIKMIYGVNNEDDIVFMEALDKVSQGTTIIVGNPSDSWGGERGKLSAELIIGLSKPTEDSLIYVSGPEPMVETLGKDLIKNGIKKDQLIQDSFPNYPDY